MSFRITVAGPAESVLDRLDRTLKRRISARIDQLGENPLGPPFSTPLEGAGNLRKSRVGDWRIIFRVNRPAGEVYILAIRPRGQAYRNLPE